MANCVDLNESQGQVARGENLSKPTKRLIIARVLKDNPQLAAEVLAAFEPRVDVRFDPKTSTVLFKDGHAGKAVAQVYAAMAEQFDKDNSSENTVAFVDDTHDLKHISNTALVNQFISSMPLFSLPNGVNLNARRLLALRTNEFLDPVKTKDLLWKLHKDFNGYLLDHSHLERLLLENIPGQHVSNAESKILYSLYLNLFSPDELMYRDIYGNIKRTQSVNQLARNSADPEVRQRNDDYLNNLLISVASVNGTSALSKTSGTDIIKEMSDGLTEHRSNLNRNVAARLFEISQTDKGDVVQLSGKVVQDFKKRKLDIRQLQSGDNNNGYVLSMLVDNMDADGNVILDKFGKPDTFRMIIPFGVQESKRNDVAIVDFKDFLTKSPLASSEHYYKNPHIIKQFFDLAGYSDAIPSTNVYKDFLANPKRSTEKNPLHALNTLYQLATNNLIALSSTIYEQQNKGGKLNEYNPFAYDVRINQVDGQIRVTNRQTALKEIRHAIDAVTGNRNPQKNPRNINKVIEKMFAGQTDTKVLSTFINSPLMNFVGNNQLVSQMVETNKWYRNQTQFNVANDLVNKNTIVTNIENVNRKIDEIRRFANSGAYTVFANDPYVTGDLTLVDMMRYDGYQANEETKGKSQMRMNEKEIAHDIMRYFADSIVKSYEFDRNGAFRGDYFPEVNSDKSAFISHSVESRHNQFPVTSYAVNGQKIRTIDFHQLFDTLYENEQKHRDAYREHFFKSWNESGLVDLSNANSPQEAIAIIEATLMPPTPIPLLFNKYWIKGSSGNFAIKPLLKSYLEFPGPDDKNFRTREILQNLAEYHNRNTQFGLTFRPEYTTWLQEFTTAALPSDLYNDKTNQSVRTGEKGLHVPASGLLIDWASISDEQLLREIAEKANPFEIAHYLNWNITAKPISRLMTGDVFQYKGNTYHEMMKDRLKRSVASVAPFMRMSLDTMQNKRYDLRMPRYGQTLQIEDELIEAVSVLGTGTNEDKEIYDGGSLTFELAEMMYQASFGGSHGLFPQASFKFFYSHTDKVSGDNLLMKYALHRVSTEWLLQGTPEVENIFKLFLGSIPFNRPLDVNVIFSDGALNKSYAPEQSLWHVFQDVRALGSKENPMRLLADIITTHPNPQTGIYDLKEKFVSQLVYKSSAKTGQKSLHNMRDLRQRVAGSGNGTIPFAANEFNVIDHVDLGMQLDATHDPENTTIAIVSQAITASLLEGRTGDIGAEMLQTLSAITDQGNADALAAFSGNIRLSDVYTYFLEDKTRVEATEAEAPKEWVRRTLNNAKHIAFKDMRLDGIELPEYPGLRDQATFQSYVREPAFRDVAKRLFIRAIALQGMDRQGIYNTTYMALEDNSFDIQDPQVEKVVLSAIHSYINKRTVAMSFAGGNYVVTPTRNLIQVYDAIDTTTNTPVTVMRSQLTNPRYQLQSTPENPTGGRELKWRGYTRGEESIFQNPLYQQYAAAVADYQSAKKQGADPALLAEYKQAGIQLRVALQQELETGGWEAQPAEFILPYNFKTKFGIRAGMQPQDIDLEFFKTQILKNHQERKLIERLLVDIETKETRHLLYQKYGSDTVQAIYDNKGQLEEIIREPSDYEIEEAVDNLFAKLFSVHDRETVLADVEILNEFQEQIAAEAAVKLHNFRKSLDILVHRIPNSGMQSIVTGKIVGFLEGNMNAILIPTELMIIQGADLDIDKSTVQMFEIDKNGAIEQVDRLEDGKVDFANSSIPALKNHLTQLMMHINMHPANAIQANTPVGFDDLQQQQAKSTKGNVLFHPDSPATLVDQKILTAEGKAMVGVEANGMKMYGVTFFVRQKTGQPLKSITLALPGANGIIANRSFTDIANANPVQASQQAWEIYSQLINAAADNAKEMILGAIGANLQTGNIINAMVMYQVDPDTLFNFLSHPVIEQVLHHLRHAADIDNQIAVNIKPTEAVRRTAHAIAKLAGMELPKGKAVPINEVLAPMIFSKDPKIQESGYLLESFLKMAAIAEEFNVGASLLSINRSLPVTMFDKFNYAQKIENFINEKFKEFFTKQQQPYDEFKLDRFLSDPAYADRMESDYADIVQQAVNLPSLLRNAPHIASYLKAKVTTDSILKNANPLYRKAESIIKTYTAGSFRNVTENEYNNILRFLNEAQVSLFLEDIGGMQLSDVNGQDLNFNFRRNDHVAAFVGYFPAYKQEMMRLNPDLQRNYFWNSLAIKTDNKGSYLHIPNIDMLGEGNRFDLQFSLNNTNPYKTLITPAGEVNYLDFLKQLFVYSLIVGKGKVSKSSFFELFEPKLKRQFGYEQFLKSGDVLNRFRMDDDSVHNSIHVAFALPGFVPAGRDYVLIPSTLLPNGIEIEQRDQLSYSISPTADPNQLPPLISLFYRSEPRIYALTSPESNQNLQATKEYSLVKPIYPTISVAVNTAGQPTHTGRNTMHVNISDANHIAQLLQGEEVSMAITIPNKISSPEVVLTSNVGFLKLNRGKSLLTKMSRLLGFENTAVNNRHKRGTQQMLHNMVNRLNTLYPEVEAEIMSSEMLAMVYGEEYRNAKGFSRQGKVVLNADMVTLDTAAHEFGHLFVATMAQTNPALYDRAMRLSLEENGPVAQMVRAQYPDLTKKELAEEIFTTLLGFKSSSDMALSYTATDKQTWLAEMWQALTDFVSEVRGLLRNVLLGSNSSVMRFNDLELSTASLGDILTAASWEFLHPEMKLDVPDDFFAESRKLNKEPVNSIKGAIEALIGKMPAAYRKEGYTERAKRDFEKVRLFVANEFNNRDKNGQDILKSGYEEDTLGTLAGRMFNRDSFNHYTDNLYRLQDLHGKKTVTAILGKKSVELDFGKLATNNPNLWVKTSIVGNEVEFELINIVNHNLEHAYNKRSGRRNLAAAYISDQEWKALGGTFESRQHDVDSLEMGIYAMQLKKQVGKLAKVGGLFSVDYRGEDQKAWVKGATMEETIANLNALAKIKGYKQSLAKPIQDLLAEKSLTRPEDYRKNLLQHYKQLVSFRSRGKYNPEEYKQLSGLLEKEKDLDKLIEALADRQAVLLGRDNFGKKRAGDYAREERAVLAELLLQVHKVRNLYRTNKQNYVTAAQKYIENPAQTGVGIFDFIYKKLGDAMQRVIAKVMTEFKPEHQRLQDALIKDYRRSRPLSVLEDWTINDARKFFAPMLEKVKAKTVDGKEVEVFTGRLKKSDDGLSQAQLDYKKFFNKQVGQAHRAMYDDADYTKNYNTGNMVPLLRTATHQAFKDAASQNTWQGYKDAVTRWWNDGFNNVDYYYQNVDSLWVDDRFKGQFEKGGQYGNRTRLEYLGLREQNGKLIIEDLDLNKKSETDLSTVLDFFVSNSHKKAEFTKVVPYVDAVRTFVTNRNQEFGITSDNTVDMLDNFNDRFVNNTTKESESWQKINKTINKLGSVSSVAMLGLNFSANIANFGTGFSANFKEAMYNSLVGLGIDNNTGLFGMKEIVKADGLVLKDWQKMDGLNKIYGFNQLDFQNMNHERFRKTDMAKFGSSSAFWLNFFGDAYNRNVVFAAQMLKDGSYAAYEMKDGKLTYNEKKDPRFFQPDGSQTKAQKALHQAIKENMRREGGLDAKGRMTKGYDNNLRNTMKVLSDKVHGSYDNWTATGLNSYALGKLFLMMRRFMQNKWKTYVSGGKMEAVMSDIEGRYVEVRKPNGELAYEWEGAWTEGVWVTMIRLLDDLRKFKKTSWKNLAPHQKKNVYQLGVDSFMLGLLVYAFAEMLGDDDELREKQPVVAALSRGVKDAAMLGINPLRYVSMFSEPFVTAGFYEDLLSNAGRVVMGEVERTPELLPAIPTLGRVYVSAQRTQEFIENLSDEE